MGWQKTQSQSLLHRDMWSWAVRVPCAAEISHWIIEEPWVPQMLGIR